MRLLDHRVTSPLRRFRGTRRIRLTGGEVPQNRGSAFIPRLASTNGSQSVLLLSGGSEKSPRSSYESAARQRLSITASHCILDEVDAPLDEPEY